MDRIISTGRPAVCPILNEWLYVLVVPNIVK